jgi:hypothetical protein
MAIHLSSRRLIATGGLALVAGVAWAVGAPSSSQSVAAPGGPPSCNVTQTPGSASLVCPPGTFSAGTQAGAPSEQDLTATNSILRPSRGLGGIL